MMIQYKDIENLMNLFDNSRINVALQYELTDRFINYLKVKIFNTLFFGGVKLLMKGDGSWSRKQTVFSRGDFHQQKHQVE